jgi:ribA/ribD-fused uncharacterized protein
MKPTIKEFQGEFRWLSNFTPCNIIFNGTTFPSVEHAYMSAKCSESSWKLFCTQESNPGKVKRESRKVKLVQDWDLIKVNVMTICIVKKFNQEPFKTKLVNTAGAFIQEGNRWGDTFWGVDLRTGKGCNTLGVIIMTVRSSIIINHI